VAKSLRKRQAQKQRTLSSKATSTPTSVAVDSIDSGRPVINKGNDNDDSDGSDDQIGPLLAAMAATDGKVSLSSSNRLSPKLSKAEKQKLARWAPRDGDDNHNQLVRDATAAALAQLRAFAEKSSNTKSSSKLSSPVEELKKKPSNITKVNVSDNTIGSSSSTNNGSTNSTDKGTGHPVAVEAASSVSVTSGGNARFRYKGGGGSADYKIRKYRGEVPVIQQRTNDEATGNARREQRQRKVDEKADTDQARDMRPLDNNDNQTDAGQRAQSPLPSPSFAKKKSNKGAEEDVFDDELQFDKGDEREFWSEDVYKRSSTPMDPSSHHDNTESDSDHIDMDADTHRSASRSSSFSSSSSSSSPLPQRPTILRDTSRPYVFGSREDQMAAAVRRSNANSTTHPPPSSSRYNDRSSSNRSGDMGRGRPRSDNGLRRPPPNDAHDIASEAFPASARRQRSADGTAAAADGDWHVRRNQSRQQKEDKWLPRAVRFPSRTRANTEEKPHYRAIKK
jgi:hypothetical protein